MKKIILAITLATFAFAQETWQDEESQSRFEVELQTFADTYDEVDGVFDIDAAIIDDAITGSHQETVDTAQNIHSETVIVEANPNRTPSDEPAQIIFTLNDNAIITSRFINTFEEKIIEILNLKGQRVFTTQASSETETVTINARTELGKGIYVFRVLSKVGQFTLFTQAFVIGG